MFENYVQMTDTEKASVRQIHQAIRALTGEKYALHRRHGNLAWGFVRGFPYRRIERRTRTQQLGDGEVRVHNRPDPRFLTHLLAKAIPGFAESHEQHYWRTKPHPEVVAWLHREEGAIPEPVRVKKTYQPDAEPDARAL